MSDLRTREMIDFLAKDAATPAKSLRFGSFSLNWLLGSAVVLALSFWFLPTRGDLGDRFAHLDFPVLFMLWSVAAILPAIRVYTLAFPEGKLTGALGMLSRFAAVPLVIIAGWTLARFNTQDLGFQFFRESSTLNGGCGMVILVAGAIHVSFLFSWIRRGATTSPMKAGAWAAVSTASFASFVIQFACANENPIHVLLWHFVPLMALTFAAAFSAKRLLRW